MRLITSDDILIFECSFHNKDVANYLGFKWDVEIKCWYTNDKKIIKKVKNYCEADFLNIKEKLKENFQLSFATDSNINIPVKNDLSYLSFQKAGIDFLNRNNQVLIGDEMGCLSGDTVININRGGGSRKIRLDEVWSKFNGEVKRGKKWDLSIPTKISSMTEDGSLRLNEVVKVLCKGKKEVFKVTTECGYSIKLTPDHELYSHNWIATCDLKIGDEIALNGVVYCDVCKKDQKISTYPNSKFLGQCKRCIYRIHRKNSTTFGKFKDKDGYIRVTTDVRNHPCVNKNGCVYEHILVYEAHINKLPLDKFIELIKYNEISNLSFLDRGVDVHHINENKSDNRLENLQVVNRSQHNKIHNKANNISSMKIHYGKIKSIEKVGEENVFDIVMKDPYRNFVANGVVVHNCGKTIQALGFINLKSFKNILIITNASLKINWKKESEKWLVNNYDINILQSSDKYEFTSGILIVNYDILKKFEKQLIKSKFDYVVADEVHYVKNKSAQRSSSFYKIVKDIQYKAYLSGTPIVDKPAQLYHIIKSLGYNESISSYRNMYCGMYWNGFAMVEGTPTNLDHLQAKLRSRFMIRRLKKDVLHDLPDKMRQIIYVEDKTCLKTEKEAVSQYLHNDNLSDEDYNNFIGGLSNFTPGFIGLISKIRKENALLKLPFCFNIIKETLESKDKIVIFAHHKEVVDRLMEEFKDIAVKLDGSTSMEDRQKAVDKFQNDPKTKIFVGSILASGTGITLTASDHCIFVEMDWTPSNMRQAEDRCVFGGQWILTSEGYKNIENVRVGDLVYTHKGNFKKVLNTYSHLERKKIKVDINAFGFNEDLSVTEDHKIFIYDSEKNVFEWIEAKNIDIKKHFLTFKNNIQPEKRLEKLKINDFVCKNFKNSFGISQTNGRLVSLPNYVELTNDLLYAFGFFVAEGWSSTNEGKSSTVNICQKIANKKMHDASEYIVDIFKRSFGIEKHSSYVNENGVKTCTIHSKNLALNFKEWFGDGVYNKKFPDWTNELNNEQLVALLDGYYHGDGYQRGNTQQAVTASLKLVSQLLIFNSNLGRTVSLQNTHGNGYIIEYANKDLRLKRLKIHEGYTLYPIQSVNFSRAKRGSERVYDLTVEDDHSFVVGNYNVHNCHRIGQKSNVTIQYIVVDNSIDSMIAKKLVKKEDVFNKIFN